MTKPKKIKEINTFEGALFTIFRTGLGIPNPNRKNAFNYKDDNFIIDTCIAGDTETWETGIKKTGESWTIVEQYKDEKEAKIGHAKWAELMKENPKKELEDIDVWGIKNLDITGEM